jgi:hypothetical protein
MTEISQSAREAAWQLRPECYDETQKEGWMVGVYDGHARIIQAIAAAEQRGALAERERTFAYIRGHAAKDDVFQAAVCLREAPIWDKFTAMLDAIEKNDNETK